jgi:thiol reductant ABC exporter CydC subunit
VRPTTREVVALSRGARGRLALAALLGVLATGSAVGLTATAAWLVTRAAEHPALSVLALAVLGVRAFGIGRGTLRYLERLVGHDAAFRVLRDVRVAVYARLERLAPAGLAEFRSGDLLARLVSDVDDVQEPYLRVGPPFVTAAVVGAGSAVLLWALLPAAGLVLLAGLLLAGVLVPWLTAAVAHAAERRAAAARGALSESVLETLRAAPDLLAYDAVPRRLQDVRAVDARVTSLAARSAAGSGVGAGGLALVGGLTVWGVLVVGVHGLHAGALPAVGLSVAVLTPLAVFEAFGGLPLAARLVERVRRSVARVSEVLAAPDPVTEPVIPATLTVAKHDLTVRGLSVRWSGAGPDVLSGVDLDLPTGRRVAVVGPSGSGKTTLTQALLRFVEPSAGEVLLDGVDLRAYAGDDVRRVIGLCAQDAHVFDTTLEDNLRIARPDATREQLRDVLAAARLLDLVDALPAGLATTVGEHGARLSSGQRQRLALARVLLADFPIVLLDEPTEHLDLATADALTADLLAATEGRTVLLVTHRLVGLHAVDEVVVLVEGQVRERGTHGELLAAGGTYATLWQLERDADAFDPTDLSGSSGAGAHVTSDNS